MYIVYGVIDIGDVQNHRLKNTDMLFFDNLEVPPF